MRLRRGLIAALVGGIVAVAGTFLPWVTVEFHLAIGGGVVIVGHLIPPLTGLDLGGGNLTLAFAWLGLVALAISRRATAALGGVLGALALLSAVLTIWALFGGLPPNVPLNGLGYGLYLTVAGASILVLGAAWAHRVRKGSAALTGSSKSRPSSGLMLGLMGGIAVLVGIHLPWASYIGDMSTDTWNGLGVGIGGILTLIFALAGAAALASPRKGAAALGVVLGVLALLAATMTLSAFIGGFAPPPLGLPIQPIFMPTESYFQDMIQLWNSPSAVKWVENGLYVSIAGASMLLLGAAWTFRERRALTASAGGGRNATSEGESPSDSRDMLSQWGGLLPQPFPLRPNRRSGLFG